MKSLTKGLIIAVAVIFCAVLALKGSALLISSGTWQATGNLSSARAGASAALLPDGRILITGGNSGSGTGAGPQASADLFNTDGTISAASPMANARSGHISVTLQNGKVLVAGGITAGGSATSTAEVFDPIANSWTPMGLGMNEARSGATVALLSDGRVLIAGGQNGSTISSTIEIFNPALGAFTSAGMMSSPRTQHTMTVLQDGRVLIVGGNNGSFPVASTDVFDPVAGAVSAGPVLNTARFGHSATTLLNGLVVVIGGNNGNANPAQVDVTPAEIVDFTAATPAFTILATNLATPREGHLAILLPNNNNILIAGGTSAGTTIGSAELFTPQESPQGVWTYGFGATGTMTAARSSAAGSANQVNVPSSTMQRNGVVMVAAGNDANGNALDTTEAYGYSTVQTDQGDYPPGTTVTMNGSGFKPGETITIQLVESPLIDTHGPYTVQADANGNFTDTSFTTDLHDVSVLFYLTATGGTSGFQAQNTFTDGNAKSGDGTMIVSPTIVAAGSTGNTLTFTFTADNGKDFNAGSQATIAVPTGWTAPTSGNVTVTNGTCTAASLGSISGSTITINMTCPGGDTFTVTYGGVTATSTVGTSTFTTQTKQGSPAGSLANISTSPSVTVQAASKLVFAQQPANTAAGASITPAVTVNVEDANGDLVNTSTASVTIAIGNNPSSGTLSGTTTVSAVNGVATFSNLSINKTGNGYTLTASSSGLTSATSSAFNITPGTATQLVFGQQPTNTAGGSSITPAVTVQVQDANNNVVTTSAASITVAIGTNPSGGTLSGTTTVSAVNGVATFSNLSINKTGNGYTLTASSSGLTGATSSAFNITVGAATKLAFTTSPSSSTGGVAFTTQPVVTLQDAGGNTVTGTVQNVTVAIQSNAGPGGVLSGTTTVAVNTGTGQATFSGLSINKAGNGYTLTATGSTVNTTPGVVVSGAFNITVGTAAKLAFAQQPTTTVAGQAISPAVTVQVQDAGGNVVTTDSSNVTIAISTGGAFSGTSTTLVAGVSGVATFGNLVPTTVGTFTLTATDGSLASATSNSFTVTAPDLTATKTDTVSGSTTLGNNWSWKIAVANGGPGAAIFTSGQTILTDNLPSSNISYGTVSVTGVTNVTNSGNISCGIASSTLTCTASGATVTIGATTGTFTAQFIATPSAVGTFANPTSGICAVDPNNVVIETNKANNSCSDTVTVTAPDLTATKTNTVSGTVALSSNWTWNIAVANVGNGSASFTAGQTILKDDLPNANVTYGTPSVANVTNVTRSQNISCSITSNTLTCMASGQTVTIGATTGTFTVQITATPSAAGIFANPRASGTCAVDPNNNVAETNEANNSCSDSVTVVAPPVISKTFGAATIPLNGTTSLTFSITNPAANAVSLTGVAFTDALPAGLVVATPNGLTGSCDSGTITATQNTGSISLSGATLTTTAPNNSCTFSVNVTGTTAGAKSNSVTVTSTNGGTGNTSTATVTVASPPTISKSFSPASITVNGTSTITFTLTNPTVNTVALTGVAFSDTFPTTPGNLLVAGTPSATTTCTGTVGATAGAGSVSFSGLSIPSGTPGTCTVTVNVTAATAGTYNNTSSAVSSSNGGTGTTSNTAMLTVTGTPPTITGGSTNSTTFTAGVAGSFTVTTSGTPTPSLSDGGAILPGSVTFHDNGDGTATLSGTTTAAGTYQFTITAHNGVNPDATQLFTLTVVAGTITHLALTPATSTITAGQSQSYTAQGLDVYNNPAGDVTSATTFSISPDGNCTSGTNPALCTATVADVNVSSHTVTGTYTNNATGSASLTVNAASPTQLVITSKAFTIIAGQCSGNNTVTSQDQYGNASNVSSDTQVDLSSASATTGKFYSDAACQTLIPVNNNKTSVSIASNSSSQTFAYADTTPSPLPNSTTTITAADDAAVLHPGTQAETILQLVFTTSRFTVNQNTCSGPIILTAENANGTPINVTVAATLGLTSTSNGAKFYSDTGCNMPITGIGTPPVSPVTVASGASAVSFSYEDSVADNPTITGTIGAYAVSQQEQIGMPPKVTSNPISVNITYGSNATFSATASGSPAPTAQWQVSTDGGHTWNNVSNGGVYGVSTTLATSSTSTTLTLTVPPVSLSGNQYQVVFTNAVETATSSAATLTVNAAALDITANNDSKTYGQTRTYGAGSSAFMTGTGQLVNGDTVASVTITDTNSGGLAIAAAGTYPLTPSAAVFSRGSANNYSITYHAGTLTVNQATQAITITQNAPATAVYNTSFTASATGGGSGNAITFVPVSGSVCSVGTVTNSSGTFSALVTMTSGTGTCQLNLNQAGNINYLAAPQVPTSVTTAQQASQATLTLNAGSPLTYSTSETLTTSGGSGTGAVTFSVTSGSCSVSGTQLTANSGTGSCSVTVTKAADSNYLVATASATVALQKAGQTITVTIPAPAMAFFGSQFTVAATASSGNTVSFYSSGVCTNSGATFTMTSGTGICTVKFDQAGDANYNPAPEVTEYVTAERVPQTISFGALSDQTFGDPPFTVSATATSSLAVMFSSLTTGVCTTSGTNGSMVTMIAAGTCTIEADQPGDADYLPAASVTQSFNVNKAVTTTAFSSSGAAVVGGPVTFTVSVADASAGSTGTPSGTVTISDGNYAIGLITLSSGGGSFTTTLLSSTGSPHNINAHYNGDPNFQTSDATPVSQVINTRGTSTTLAFNPTQGTFETPDTITATVTETAGLPSPSGTPDSFTGSGNLGTARKGATATQLLSGLILVVGGGDANSNFIGSAELYNPATGNSAPSGGTPIVRYGAAAALLADGRVLIVGGTGSGGVLNSAEIYNSTTDSFTSTGSLQTARTGATATLLTSGKVVVIGGSDGTSALSSVEVFDPAANSGTGAFSNPGSGTGLGTARFGHVAALLANGTILVAGGNSGSAVLNSAEIYDPTANTSTALTATLSVAREFAGAAEMPNNYVLVAAGDSDGSTPLGSADLYDPQSQKFYASNATLGTARTQLAAVQLNDGRVLAVGGAGPVPPNTNAALASVEPYTPAFTPQGAVALSSTGSGDTFTGTPCQLQPATPATSPAQSTCTETIDPGSAVTDSVTGNYPADAVHSASSSGATSFTVLPATTSTTVNSSANPSMYGQSVTFTGVVSNTSIGSTGTPTGSVNFSIDGGAAVTGVTASCPSGSLTYSLCATYSTASLTVSSSPHGVSATYTNSDGNFSGSSGSLSGGQIVNKATPVFSNLTASQTITYGTPSINLAGTISAPCGNSCTVYPPTTETVSITINGVTVTPAIGANGSFSATFTTGTIPASATPYAITYSYNANYADTNFQSATDATRTLTVNKATPVFSNLTASQTIPYGTATITVTGKLTAPTATPPNTDSVTVSINGTSVSQTVFLSGGSFTATLSTAAIPASMTAYAISYSFAGDSNFNPASDASTSLTVKPVPLSITAASGMMTYGGTLPTINTGNATYVSFVNGEGVSVLGAGFSCSTTATSSSPVGTYPTNCSGAVDSNYVISYTPGAITVKAAPLTITASSGSMTYGGSPFVVMPMFSGLVNGDTPATFNFSPNIPPACLPMLTSTTPAGTYTSTCTGAVDNNYSITPMPGSVTVLQANTYTTVSSSLNPSNWQNVVTLTATVTPQYTRTTPTGSVSFYNNIGMTCPAYGTVTALDTEPLSSDTDPLSSAPPYTASTSTPSLPVGTDTIIACYNGDTNFYATSTGNGTATTLSQVVIAAPIATLSPANLSFGGQQGGTLSGAQTVYVCNGPSGASGSPCFNAPVSTAALVIQSIGFTNPNTNTAYFTETSTCPNGGNGLAVGGSCPINVRFAPPPNTQGIATALLTVTDNNENVTGSTQSASLVGAGTSAVMGVGSLSTYAIFGTANGCSSVNVSGNGTVDSFGGSTTSGNIGTNGNVTLSGNPVVSGAVYSPIGGTGSCSSKTMTGLSTSGKAQATGGLQALTGPVNYPLPSASNPPTTTQNISGSCGSIGGCSNNGTKNVILAPGQYGNLNISGGTIVNVSGGTYNINSLTLSGNSSLVVTPNTPNPGPVVVNLAGKSLSGGNAVLDLSGGSMSNSSGMASNLQFYYAGSQPIKLSGGTGSYAIVYAPNAPINVSGGSHFYGSIIGSTVNSSGNTAIHYPTTLPSLSSPESIWFSSSGLTVKGLPNTGSVKLYVTNASINFMANGTTYNLPVPNAVITFSSTATSASTTWDATNNRWSTIVPTSSVNNVASIRTFFDGVAYQVPSGGFPTGIQNVTWQAAYSTSQTGLSFNWQWGAAVYSSFTNSYSSLTVNPIDNNPLYGSDPAGTPENYKSNLVFGDTGAGYTGLYANFVGVVPTIAPMNVAPSSYDFGVVSPGGSTTTPPGTFVLTNNDSVSYIISTIQMTGTYAGDFGQTNTCGALPVTLPGGGSCTFTVTFTPSASSGTKETAKIVINDNANNSPQTVFFKGTVQ